MSRISNTATSQVFKQEGGGFLVLLTLNHPTLATPLRFVNNNVNITSNGNEYLAYPFDVKLPEERDGARTNARLVIDNVDRQIAQTIRLIDTAPTIGIQIVRIDSLNTVEVTLPTFTLSNVEWDALSVQADLILDYSSKEPFPQRSFTPSEYPGIFAE